MSAPLRSLLFSLALSSLLACGGEPKAADADRVERMVKLCSTHHALPPALLDRLSGEDVRVLRALARDRDRPLWLRSRAVALVGARPSEETRALWSELRQSPERELRIQAAWAQGLSLAGERRASFAISLLDDDEAALREAGAHLLAIAGGPHAEALARERLIREEDVVVRAVLSRKLLAKERPR